jgi:hypothetical protein
MNNGDTQEKADLEKAVASDLSSASFKSKWWSWGHSALAVLAIVGSFVGGILTGQDFATVAKWTGVGAAVAAAIFVAFRYWNLREKGRHWRKVEVLYRNLLDDVRDPDVSTEEEIELLQDKHHALRWYAVNASPTVDANLDDIVAAFTNKDNKQKQADPAEQKPE